MKMAKASEAEWQKCMDFANGLEEVVNELGDKDLGLWVRKNYVWLGRTLYGYRVLVDNCCDPAQDVLDWRPDLKAFLESKQESEKEEVTT